MVYPEKVIPLHVPITTVIRERSRSQTVVKNYGHQLRRHPESEMNQNRPLVYWYHSTCERIDRRTVPWFTNWNNTDFWRAIGVGAFAGALGGAFGYAGSALGIASTGNNIGYNLISQTTNSIVTNSVFGNDIGFGDMLGIAAGTALGSFLPYYKATQGGWFRNTVGETLHNTARGMATGAAQGLVDWALKGNSRYFFQDIFGGGISGFSRTVVMNLILGAPYSSTFSKFSQGRYRTGGLSSFLFSKRGVALGNNLFVAKGKHDLWTMVHENYHISQQMQPDTGWAGFYGQWLIELLSNIGRNIYKIDGTLENAAEYSTYKLFMGITNAIEERNKIAL